VERRKEKRKREIEKNTLKKRRRHDNTVENERSRKRVEDKESLKILMN
jgi:hypothetical protein